MPRGDGTGPMGLGKMTGRGLGYCTGAIASLYDKKKGRVAGLGISRKMELVLYSCLGVGLGLGLVAGLKKYFL